MLQTAKGTTEAAERDQGEVGGGEEEKKKKKGGQRWRTAKTVSPLIFMLQTKFKFKF